MEFEVPKELAAEQLALLSKARKGKLRAGVNEVTKAVERGKALLVLVAQDVSPPEIVMHLPSLCREKNIPCSFVESRKELGENSGLGVPTTSVAVLDAGPAKTELEAVLKHVSSLAGKSAAPKPVKQERKEAGPIREEKKEEKPIKEEKEEEPKEEKEEAKPKEEEKAAEPPKEEKPAEAEKKEEKKEEKPAEAEKKEEKEEEKPAEAAGKPKEQ